MTEAESIIISQSTRHSKINSVRKLAERSGMPYTTLRDKVNRPETIKLSDIVALNPYCKFTAESLLELVEVSKMRGVRRRDDKTQMPTAR